MQTSIEWLEEKLKVSFSEELNPLRGFFVIAKEMHKEEIIDSYNQGYRDAEHDSDSVINIEDISKYSNADNYYNQTYKQ